MDAASIWVLVFLIGCPQQPGFCAAQYVATESRQDCDDARKLILARMFNAGRWTRAECYRDPSWPVGLVAYGVELKMIAPTPKRVRS